MSSWLIVDVTATLDLAELLWIIMNGIGVLVTFCAWSLARADRNRLIRSGQNGGLRELADDGEREEAIRLTKHLGNMSVGILFALAPSPVRETLADAASYAALWLIIGASLLMTGTTLHLRARYRFAMYRRYGHRGTLRGFVVDTAREVLDVVIKRNPGGFMADERSGEVVKRTIASPDVVPERTTLVDEPGVERVVVIPMAEWKQALVRGIRSAVQFYLVIAGGGTVATASTGIGIPPSLLLGLPTTGNLYLDSLVVSLVAGVVVFIWNAVEFWFRLDEKAPKARA